MERDNKSFTLKKGYTKPFIGIDEQIRLLQSRGLIINDIDNAREILKRTSYYRLSGYSLSMRNNDVFDTGTTIDKVYEVYRFDDAFRKLILSYTAPVEVSFRSYISYEHSRLYGPLGYMDACNFNESRYHESFLERLEEDIARSDDVFVDHYKNDRGGVFPIWVAIECCSFGELSKLYKNIKPGDKSLIAKRYSKVPRAYVENWLQALVYARNIAAHNGRLYGRWLRSIPVKLPNRLKSTVDQKSVFAVIFAMHKLQPTDKLAEALIRDISSLFEKYHAADKKMLGFPDSWLDILRNNR